MRAVAATALAAAALAASGCASDGLGRRPSWDPDAPVVPLRERAAASGARAEIPSDAAAEPGRPARLRRYVVLLPDADGRVGALDVATSDGAVRTLSRAAQALDFDDPSRPLELSAAEVAADAGAALAAEPPAPQGFVVYFDLDSAAMTAPSRGAWDAIAAAVVARPVPEVTVAGYADRAGDGEHNLDLSRRRAEAVRDLLIAAGVVPERIEVNAYGEARPAVPTPDGVAEPRNRRVELRVR